MCLCVCWNHWVKIRVSNRKGWTVSQGPKTHWNPFKCRQRTKEDFFLKIHALLFHRENCKKEKIAKENMKYPNWIVGKVCNKKHHLVANCWYQLCNQQIAFDLCFWSKNWTDHQDRGDEWLCILHNMQLSGLTQSEFSNFNNVRLSFTQSQAFVKSDVFSLNLVWPRCRNVFAVGGIHFYCSFYGSFYLHTFPSASSFSLRLSLSKSHKDNCLDLGWNIIQVQKFIPPFIQHLK